MDRTTGYFADIEILAEDSTREKDEENTSIVLRPAYQVE